MSISDITLLKRPRKWRHKKRGGIYTEIGRGLMQSTAPEWDDTEMVIYRNDVLGTLYVRSVAEFTDGRFEPVEH